MSLTLGLVINPIAGVGAELAWKGSDDVEAAWKAVEKGHTQPVWNIVDRAIKSIPPGIQVNWILGGSFPLDISGEVVYMMPDRSWAADTHQAVKQLVKHDIDAIVFAGGDGTAADVANQSGDMPIIGIPGGVKIFSPCFLHRPEDLGTFIQNWEGEKMEVDILDLDEDAYREGRAEPRLVTSAYIPVSSEIQLGKISWSSVDDSTFELIAERIEEEGHLAKTIMVGPGSTMKNIFGHLGCELSLLGVDVVAGGNVIIYDGTTEDLLRPDIDELWLSPIGNQGHILGRGNRQIPLSVLEQLEKEKIRIFSTMNKVRNTPELYVDSGDPDMDKRLQGYYAVIVGYHEEIMRKVS